MPTVRVYLVPPRTPMPLALLCATAAAHGPTPAVVGVGTTDGAGPVHLALTEGVAVRNEEGWRWVCPATWGSAPVSPPLAGVGADLAWLPGADGRYAVTLTGDVLDQGTADLSVYAVLDWAGDDDGVWALTTDGSLWNVQEGKVVWADVGTTGVVPGSGALHALVAEGGHLHHTTVSRGGDELSRVDLGPVSSGNPIPRMTDDTLWVVERMSGLQALHRVHGELRVPVGPEVAEVLGPVAVGGRTWVALDGVLHEVADDAVVPLAGGPQVSCLEEAGGSAWVCGGGDLLELTPSGAVGAVVAAVLDVSAPNWSSVLDDDLALCYAEWRVWAGDLGVDPGPFPDPAAPTTTTPSEDPGASASGPPPAVDVQGCGCVSAAPQPWFPLLLFWFPLVWRKRCCEP